MEAKNIMDEARRIEEVAKDRQLQDKLRKWKMLQQRMNIWTREVVMHRRDAMEVDDMFNLHNFLAILEGEDIDPDHISQTQFDVLWDRLPCRMRLLLPLFEEIEAFSVSDHDDFNYRLGGSANAQVASVVLFELGRYSNDLACILPGQIIDPSLLVRK
ncbi:unnamed protein product [Calypogeia fissa]